MLKIVRVRNRINSYGEIVKSVATKITYELIDVDNFDELLKFERLIRPMAKIRVYYDKGQAYIQIIGNIYREEVRIVNLR